MIEATDAALLGGLLLQTLLYGIFIIIFVLCLLALTGGLAWTGAGVGPGAAPTQSIIASTAFFVIITAHWCLTIARYVDWELDGTSPDNDSTAAFLMNVWNPVHLAQTALILTATALADIIFIYRLYILWERRILITVVPLATLLGHISCSSCSIVFSGKFRPGNLELGDNITRLFQVSAVCVLITNIYCTSMIALRLHRAQTNMRILHSSSSTTTRLLRAIVETAVIYTLSIIATIACQFSGSVWANSSIDIVAPITGITFCLMLVRIRLTLTVPYSLNGSRSQPRTNISSAMNQLESDYPLGRVSIRIDKEVCLDIEGESTDDIPKRSVVV